MEPQHRQWIGLGAVLFGALLAYRFTLDLELMGWDSYPTIAAARVTDLYGLLGSFTEELMDGRYPGGRFYRPVTNLLFAADHALWGVDPWGYQLTNLLALLLGVVTTFLLARRWFGTNPAPLVAALVFALHPLQAETVPVAARRADMLFPLFLSMALATQPLGSAPGRRARWLGALGVLLAAASKETGAIALPVFAAYHALVCATGNVGDRLRWAWRAAAPATAVFAVYLVLRTAVLGGLGGHPGESSLAGAASGLLAAPAYARSLLLPQPWFSTSAANTWHFVVLLGLGVAALSYLARTQRGDAASGAPGLAKLSALLLFWWLCLLAMTGIAGPDASWYAVPFLPVYALFLAALANGAWRLRADGSRGSRRAAALSACVLLALVTSPLRFSALVHPYPEWREVSRQASVFLADFRADVAAAELGTTLTVAGLPLGTGVPLEKVGIRSALCMSDYSVEAYAELVLPDQRVKVELKTGAASTLPMPGFVTVDAIPLPSPALVILGKPPE